MRDESSIPLGICHCGCGQSTPVYTRTRPDKGWVAGTPLRYIQGHACKGKPSRVARTKCCSRCNQHLGPEHFDLSPRGFKYPYCKQCRVESGAAIAPWEPPIDDGFGHWLAGFIDGEGCFRIGETRQGFSCRFYIGIRADDRPIIEEIHKLTGLGHVNNRRAVGDWNPQITWDISSKTDCYRLVCLLDRYPLRAKKKRDYAIWREAVLRWIDHAWESSWDDIRELRVNLVEVREFHSG